MASGATCKGRLVFLTTNIRLGCERLPDTNTLDYFSGETVTKKKGFTTTPLCNLHLCVISESVCYFYFYKLVLI